MKSIVPSDIQYLFQEHGAEEILEAGQVLFLQGAASDAVYYVVSGSLDVYAGYGGDHPVLLNHVEPGHLVGELGAITQSPRSATLVATTRVVLSRISTEHFRGLLANALSLVETMLSSTRGYVISADTARIDLGNTFQQVQKRVNVLGEEKKQLEELLRLRDELESMVVHDLRNPLNTVTLVLDLLEPMKDQVRDTERYTLLVRMAKTATQSMTHLISMLLDIARLEAGRLVLDISEFDLSAMLEELASMQQMQVMRKQIEIVTHSPPGLMVKADRGMLWRVVLNVLDNAIKFAPRMSRIEVAAVSTGSRNVCVRVTDAGPGIPPGERERIFEKFTQVSDAEHVSRGGTGLGLTFCRMAVEAHGGSIRADAGPSGTGNSIQIELPQD